MLASISPKFAVCRPLDYVPITPASLVLTNEYCGSPCGWLEEEGSRVSRWRVVECILLQANAQLGHRSRLWQQWGVSSKRWRVL